jgi:iron complex outermembrane receptor protein
VEITVVKEGFNPVTVSAIAALGPSQVIPIVLERQTAIEEHVTVSATRTDKRIEDQPMRVESGARRNRRETTDDARRHRHDAERDGRLRVQATSPSLGAASVRVQGMRGRYTRFLSDGCRCSARTSAVSACCRFRRPTWDSEVIKGVASALYGAGALGGVVDLISRRPAKEPAREALVNRTSRGGTDARLFAAQPFTERWSGTLARGRALAASATTSTTTAGPILRVLEGVLRPRVFWSDGTGRSLFATGGAMWEQRRGGTMPSAV